VVLLSILSTTSNRALEIGEGTESYLSVCIVGYPVTATTEVWIEAGDVSSLANFFVILGESGGPWKGAKTWSSLEGDFKLSATCSALGVVTFDVELCGLQGAPEEWRITAGLETEFGQLDGFAACARNLWET
jgi:hypothetical protein